MITLMIVSNKQDIVNNNNSSNIPVSKKYVFNGFLPGKISTCNLHVQIK